MSTMDDVPSHWISKASIAKRIGISRVTVDKQLIRIEKDKELSGRLNVLVVDEGKRKLYFYDPSDVDAVFSELQKKSRRKSSGVKRTNSRVNDNVKLLDDAIVKLELQKEELKVIALEKEVARLEDNLKDLRGENTFLKAQLTDQRPNVAPTAPEATEEAVVPPVKEPKPSTIADIKEAMVDADKSNIGPEDSEEGEVSSMDEMVWEIEDGKYDYAEALLSQRICDRLKKEKSYIVDLPPFGSPEKERGERIVGVPKRVRTKYYKKYLEDEAKAIMSFTKRHNFYERSNSDGGAFKELRRHIRNDIRNRAELDPLINIPADVVMRCIHEEDRLDDVKKGHLPAQRGDDKALKLRDAELEEKLKSPPIEDTQPTEEAPKEKEARRDNIAPKAEPQQVQKKGFWNWIKGY